MDENTRTVRDESPLRDTQEFFDNASQINANNYKETHAAFQNLTLTAASRSQTTFDQMQSQLLSLQTKINEEHFSDRNRLAAELASVSAMRARHADMWGYEQAYDLGNPVTTGAGDALRSSAYTANRTVDTASAGVAATIPASSDIRLIATVESLASQLLSFAQALQNSKQTPAA